MLRANPAVFRQAASRFVTGVAVLTAFDERGEVCGMTANSFVTVSLKPPTVLVSVMPGRMHQAISASGRYGVNVLPEDVEGCANISGTADDASPTTTSSTVCETSNSSRSSPAR